METRRLDPLPFYKIAYVKPVIKAVILVKQWVGAIPQVLSYLNVSNPSEIMLILLLNTLQV